MMKAWIEEYSSRLITKVSMLFTVMILMHSIVGYSLDGRRVSILFIASLMICCLEYVIFGIQGLSRRWKWLLHYIGCFVAYLLIISVGKGFVSIMEWDVANWGSCLVLYTIGYVGLSKIYLWQYE